MWLAIMRLPTALAYRLHLVHRSLSSQKPSDLATATDSVTITVGVKSLHPSMAKTEVERKEELHLQFFSSVREGNINDMKKMLLQGADVNFLLAKRSALMVAVGKGDKKVVKFLIEEGANINFKDYAGESILMRAVQYRNVEVVKLLLEHGAEPNELDNEGLSALARACSQVFDEQTGNRQLSIVKLLLKHKAQINFQDQHGESLLISAVRQYGDGLLTTLLLKKGADVNLQDEKGTSALMIAAGSKNTQLIRQLLKHGAHIDMQDDDGKSALTFAYEAEETAFQLLLDHGAQVDLQDKNGLSPLMHACSVRKLATARAMLEGGAQVNLQNKREGGWSALMYAAHAGTPQLVELLLKYKADVDLQDENGKSSLMISIEGMRSMEVVEMLLRGGAQVNLQDKMGRSAIMQLYLGNWLRDNNWKVGTGTIDGNAEYLLLEYGAKVNLLDMEGRSALMLACQNNTIHDVRGLLSRGAEVNLQDKEGWSALMHAAAGLNRTLKLKQLVKRKGAVEFNLKNSKGHTALTIASLNGNAKAVKVLLHGGADIDFGDNDGRSALVHASGRGYIDVARLLLEHGAHLDWQDNEGYTPLMMACCNGHKETASFLIDSGASVHLKNKDGKTAYDFALEKNYTGILHLFTKLRPNSSFPGILFSEDVKKELVTSSAKYINLEDVGISLSIPEDALSSTDPPLEVQILPCFSGSWEVPENLELVSPAYIVEPSREVVFRKEVLVKIWHHANLETDEDCEKMMFLSASTTPEYRNDRPVYKFQEMTGMKGSFRPREEQPVGEIALKHFCILGIFRYFFQSHLYSARLYTARERKAVIFCMCLSQPQYIKLCDFIIPYPLPALCMWEIQWIHCVLNEAEHADRECCDEEIAALYEIPVKARDLVVRDGVTITAEEVSLKQNCTKEWKTLCKTDPASILKNAINIHTRYEPGDCNFPKIEIAITSVPRSQESEPLELRVEGLNVESVFKLPPGEFLKFEVDTTKIKAAMDELQDEIKGQSLECSESNNILPIATQMLEHMKSLEELLRVQDPNSVSSSVLCMLRDMDGESRLLRDEATKTLTSLKVSYDMEAHVEDVSLYSRQLKVIYSANIHHCFGTGNATEWHAATSLFITNAANLMSSIKEVLKASKSAQALPNNCLPPDFTPQLPSGREAPTMEELCVAVVDHPTGKRFNLSHHISSSWKKIGLKLGMEFSQLESIERNQYDDEERLMKVFKLWVDNAAGLPHHARYPLSWQGLNTLLEDIGKLEVAKQYFEFLQNVKFD